MRRESVYHEGEVEVQDKSGSVSDATENSEMITSDIHPAMESFIHTREFVAVTSVGRDGRVMASVLFGPPGFVSLRGLHDLTITTRIHKDEPLLINGILSTDELPCPAALLFINLATRKRFSFFFFLLFFSLLFLSGKPSYSHC